MSKNDQDLKDFLAIKEGIKQAQEDSTPYPIVNEDNIIVAGDANKTQVKRDNYQIVFKITEDMIKDFPYDPAEVEKKGNFYRVVVNFKNKTITPRNEMRLVATATQLMPFFNELKENGEITEFKDQDAVEVFLKHYGEFDLAIYNLVASFLGIDDYYGEYMLPIPVLTAMTQLINNHPELFNEADGFFE